MWLFSSSVGRKFIMSLTGAALILFLTFHCLMNSVAILWPTAYNTICALLGANWYALVASMGLALLFIIHIIYALALTIQNRRARGNDRYLISKRPAGVEWSSQNMLVLGFVILAFLVLHLVQFWAKMQLAELQGAGHWYTVDGVAVPPTAGTLFLQFAFSQVWVSIVYIVAFVALWFHLTHGFWSMFQSIGWDNTKWIPRLKCIGNWWVTIVVALFVVQVVVFTSQSAKNYYVEDVDLEVQYLKSYEDHLSKELQDLSLKNPMAVQPALVEAQNTMVAFQEKFAPTYMAMQQAMEQAQQQAAMEQYLRQMNETGDPSEDVDGQSDESAQIVKESVPVEQPKKPAETQSAPQTPAGGETPVNNNNE